MQSACSVAELGKRDLMMTTEERRTENFADGFTHTTTIIERDVPERRSGGGSGILIGALLLIALIVGGYFVMQAVSSNNAKNDAIGAAAQDVGDAAKDVGDAAQDAANKLGN